MAAEIPAASASAGPTVSETLPGPTAPADLSSPTSPPSQPRRQRVAFVGVLGAIFVAVLLVLILTNAIPIVPASGAKSSPLTYAQAAPIANHTASGFQGGGWYLIVAAGVDSYSGAQATQNLSKSGSGSCNVTLAPGQSATISIPAYSGSRTAGEAPAWEFLYRNGAETILAVLVINGGASVFATISGGICMSLFGLFSTIPPFVIDSSRAGAAVSTDAAGFLNQHPDANASFGLVGGVSFLGASVGPRWSVEYTTCPEEPIGPASGTEFNATVNATSGAVIYYNTTASVACGSFSVTAEMPLHLVPISRDVVAPAATRFSEPSTP